MILLLGIPRFILVLNTNISGNYNLVSIVFLFMWISPFIFLTADGRKDIGMKLPTNYYWLVYSFLMGIGVCTLIFVVANNLFNHSLSNFFVYLSKSYAVSGTSLTEADRFIYFLIYALIGMTFSPIGEELFYRGIVHESFVPAVGENKASVVDSLAVPVYSRSYVVVFYVFNKPAVLSM